jgi:hypothetical protein
MRGADITSSTRVIEAQAAEFLRLASVVHRTGLARSTIYRLMAEHQFPFPVKPPHAQWDGGVPTSIAGVRRDVQVAKWRDVAMFRSVLTALPVREKLAAPDIVLITRIGMPLTPAAAVRRSSRTGGGAAVQARQGKPRIAADTWRRGERGYVVEQWTLRHSGERDPGEPAVMGELAQQHHIGYAGPDGHAAMCHGFVCAVEKLLHLCKREARRLAQKTAQPARDIADPELRALHQAAGRHEPFFRSFDGRLDVVLAQARASARQKRRRTAVEARKLLPVEPKRVGVFFDVQFKSVHT